MKQLFFLLTLSITCIAVGAQKAEWKEMKDFHAVMSATFHPAEENNLQPLKEKAADLEAKAKLWQQSAVPAGFNALVTKPILNKLLQQCKLIKKSVNNKKPDTVLKEQITAAHETFHEITEKCREESH